MKLPENWKFNISKLNLGFTLLELLVVIAIIGILVSLGVASYTTAQARGRNAKRVGDMESIQDALEQYYVINQEYNTSAQGNIVGGLWPTDPGVGTYTINIAADEYCACAPMEGEEGNANAPTGTSCNFVATGGTLYCVGNLQ